MKCLAFVTLSAFLAFSSSSFLDFPSISSFPGCPPLISSFTEFSSISTFSTLSQFHQQFMSSFCTDFLSPKIYKPKLQVQKSWAKHFLTRKLLMKLTPCPPSQPCQVQLFHFYRRRLLRHFHFF